MQDLIQVVDDLGNTIGAIEKQAAHENGGVWHRAVSVLLFDAEGRLLIQQRASQKYHFPNLWANSCCSHPAHEEAPIDAAKRTILRELGVVADIEETGFIRYEALDPESGLTEREHDHIFVGIIGAPIEPNPEEIQAVRWITPIELRAEIEKQPEQFAPWLPLILDAI